MTTWRRLFEDARREVSDTSPIVQVAPNEAVLDVEFDNDYGLSQGPAVLVWTEDRVYFPAVYDGLEWLESAPRNPTTEGQAHVGGE